MEAVDILDRSSLVMSNLRQSDILPYKDRIFLLLYRIYLNSDGINALPLYRQLCVNGHTCSRKQHSEMLSKLVEVGHVSKESANMGRFRRYIITTTGINLINTVNKALLSASSLPVEC